VAAPGLAGTAIDSLRALYQLESFAQVIMKLT
jgi:hypothetical protein